MSRMHGQFTWQTPQTAAVRGDDTSSAAVSRIFTASERCTVVEVGVIAGDSANPPNTAFAFRALKRTGGDSSADTVVDVFKSTFAAEGGPGGDPSVQGFDNANAIASGIITNTAGLLVGGKALRAYCEVALEKGDQLVLDITTGGGASTTGVFYAKCYPNGAGLVETNDVESN
jgi:hypothetical protein